MKFAAHLGIQMPRLRKCEALLSRPFPDAWPGHRIRSPYQLEPPIKRLTSAAVQEVITSLNPKKVSGYDLITGKILKELPPVGIKYLTKLFNAI
jgi:hypothetical protein